MKLIATLPLMLVVAACGGAEEDGDAIDGRDPAVTGAAGEDIMVDPDRVDQSGADGALAGGDPASAAIPLDPATREQVNKARDEARQLAGGRIASAPDAEDGLSQTIIAAAQSVQRGNSGVDCSTGVQYSAAWASKMPDPFAVYPRGAVKEAAGNDAEGCSMRVAEFTTPVPAKEVVNYYHTRARAAGFSADVRRVDSDIVLGGRKGDAAYVIYVGIGDAGQTVVQLLAREG